MTLILFLGSAASFLVTFLLTPILIEFFKKHGMVGEDIHKISRPVCAEMGGAAVLLGFSVGFCIILLFSSAMDLNLIYVFLTIIFVGFVGILDDLFTLRQRYKPFLTALASVPLIFTCLDRQGFWFPFVGFIFLGVYWIFVPLGVATASNMTNMMAGFNGLEGGVGAISCFALGVASAIFGKFEACSIAFPLSTAFLAFLKYNWYPAKVFPGDTGTLVSGAAIAAISIFSGIEFAGICMIAPCAIDFTLKMFSRRPFSQRSLFGDTEVGEDQALIPPVYPALAHAFMRVSRLKENELVLWLLFMQFMYAFIGVLLTAL
jgi:UDP-N-acetylglucosamine--dolichyl-phosphate N-acetylglucosaminephosphotransferase